MSPDDIKSAAVVVAAFITLVGAIFQFFLAYQKERVFEKERQRFTVEQDDAKNRHAKEMQEAKHAFDREQNEQTRQHTRELQFQKAELEAWRASYELEAKIRDEMLRQLRAAIFTAFDTFQGVLRLAQRAEDQAILSALAKCIQALSTLDVAIDAAKTVVRNEVDADKLNRLRILKKFFLRIILDLTRRKSERLKAAALFRKLEGRLLQRREIAVRYLKLVIDEIPVAPGHSPAAPVRNQPVADNNHHDADGKVR